MIPIETAGAAVVSAFKSTATWQEQMATPASAQDVDLQSILAEDHHRYYGKPWLAGRYYVDKLMELGLDKTDRVLDLGCGAGRVGVWLARFLEVGGYYGVDSHLKSLIAFAGYEAFLHDLFDKRPRLLLNDAFELGAFGQKFDFILDFSVTQLLSAEARLFAFRQIARVCAPDARLITMQRSGPPEEAAAMGLHLVQVHTLEHPLFARGNKRIDRSTPWYELRFRPTLDV